MKVTSAAAAVLGLVACMNAYAEPIRSVIAPEPALMLDTAFSHPEEEAAPAPGSKATFDTSVLNEAPLASAINPEPSTDTIGARERIYDGLLPGDGYTVTMDSFPDQNGSTECVQLIKSLLAAPRTIFWKEGRKLQEHFADVKPGTAIATFVKGQYPQKGRTGMHAAIFVRATKAGIFVLDQFRGRSAVTERFIPWHSDNKKRSNNASAYSTVKW